MCFAFLPGVVVVFELVVSLEMLVVGVGSGWFVEG